MGKLGTWLKSLWEDFKKPSPPYPLDEEEWEQAQETMRQGAQEARMSELLKQAQQLTKPKRQP